MTRIFSKDVSTNNAAMGTSSARGRDHSVSMGGLPWARSRLKIVDLPTPDILASVASDSDCPLRSLCTFSAIAFIGRMSVISKTCYSWCDAHGPAGPRGGVGGVNYLLDVQRYRRPGGAFHLAARDQMAEEVALLASAPAGVGGARRRVLPAADVAADPHLLPLRAGLSWPLDRQLGPVSADGEGPGHAMVGSQHGRRAYLAPLGIDQSQRPAGEAENNDGVVLHPGRQVRTLSGLGREGAHLGNPPEAFGELGENVTAFVGEAATAVAVGVEEPGAELLRAAEFSWPGVADGAPGQVDRAEEPCFQDPAGRFVQGIKDVMVGDHERDVAGHGRGVDPPGLRHAGRDRLIHVDVDSAARGGLDDVGLAGVIAADQDGLDR